MKNSIKISGFSMGRNLTKLYYPVKQSILSILPLVDEFVMVLGDSDLDDTSRDEVEGIGSPKIKIIDSVWDLKTFPRGMEHAHQTDIAKAACSGDWLFYLQADEVIHENDLPAIRQRCEELADHSEVEGLLFSYLHFWGDYHHYHRSHGWYPYEIRVIRNDPDIHSWESAQSFRHIPGFDGVSYRKKEGTRKLRIVPVRARVFHYGWVRPPELMKNKIRYFNTNHRGPGRAEAIYNRMPPGFDYGPLDRLAVFKGTHPAVMKEWIAGFSWGDQLQYTGLINPLREKHKHERLKYRLLSFLERLVYANTREIGGFKNYTLLKRL